MIESVSLFSIFFFFNDTATPEIYTLSLHDALPISRRRHQIGGHLVGDDARQRRLAEAGRTVEEHVVHALATPPGCLDRHEEAGHRLLLSHELVEGTRAELALELRLLRRRHPAEDLRVVGRRGRAHEVLAPR